MRLCMFIAIALTGLTPSAWACGMSPNTKNIVRPGVYTKALLTVDHPLTVIVSSIAQPNDRLMLSLEFEETEPVSMNGLSPRIQATLYLAQDPDCGPIVQTIKLGRQYIFGHGGLFYTQDIYNKVYGLQTSEDAEKDRKRMTQDPEKTEREILVSGKVRALIELLPSAAPQSWGLKIKRAEIISGPQ